MALEEVAGDFSVYSDDYIDAGQGGAEGGMGGDEAVQDSFGQVFPFLFYTY